MIILTAKNIRELKEMIKLQSIMLNDDYMVGLYNGMETMIACIEKREPKLYKSSFRNCILNNPNLKKEKIMVVELEEVGVKSE